MSDFVIENGVLEEYTGDDESVVVPENITVVGPNSFAWCSRKIKSVILSKNVYRIGVRAFSGCSNLQSVVMNGLIEIAEGAFEWCENLQNIIIPKGVTDIEKGAFYHCSSLQNIVIPEGVDFIGASAFEGCSNLQNIIIPESVTEIGTEVFSGCKKLTYMVANQKKVLQIQSKNVSFCLIDKTGEKNGFLAYSANACSDNFTDFVNTGKWNAYDIDIINNGPCYKYKAEARFLGALGRLNDPVDLTDECKELYVELLVKNAKKLIPIAEEIDCPEIIEMMIKHEIINGGNKKAINKLLKASANEKIAAFAE